MELQELVGGAALIIIGFYILRELTTALDVAFGSAILGLFVIAGILWFVKEIGGGR